jgi:acetate kinase
VISAEGAAVPVLAIEPREDLQVAIETIAALR